MTADDRSAPTPEVEAGEREVHPGGRPCSLRSWCGLTYAHRHDPSGTIIATTAPSQSPQGSELGDGAVEGLSELGDLVFYGDMSVEFSMKTARTIAQAILASDWLAQREAAAWDRCLGEVFQRLYDSVSHGTERGEPWVPWLVSLVKSLRDDQPIPNPFRQEA